MIYKLLTKQDAASSAIRNAPLSSESFFSGVIENLPVISGSSGLIQSMKGSTDTHMNALSRHLDSAGGNVRWHNSEKCNERTEEGMLPTSIQMLDRKKSRNIGSKSKRLLIDDQDVLALRLTWEEVQGMLRAPQSARPSVVVIEDYEFEEYEVSDDLMCTYYMLKLSVFLGKLFFLINIHRFYQYIYFGRNICKTFLLNT